MNVFKRMKDIISSNINSALDRMEDPEKMIDLSSCCRDERHADRQECGKKHS